MKESTGKKAAMATMAIMSVMLMVTAAALPILPSGPGESAEGASAEEWFGGFRISVAWIPWTIGDWIAGYSPGHEEPAGDQNEVNAYGRKVAMIYSVHETQTVSYVSSKLIENDLQTWQLAQLHMSRAAEISASSLWAEGKAYDPDQVLTYANAYALAGNGYYNTQHALDYGYDAAANRVSDWNQAAWSSDIQSRIVWRGGSTALANGDLRLDFCSIADAAPESDVIYLVKSVNPDTLGSNTIWSFGHSGTITPVAGGDPFALYPGANDVSSLRDGLYRLSPGTYGGSFLSSVSVGAAPVKGGAAIICDTNAGYVTVGEGDNLSIWYNGTKHVSEYLRYSYSADGNTYDSSRGEDRFDSLPQSIRIFDRHVASLRDVMFKASVAGQVMWTISANAHRSNALLSPSSVAPQLVNVGMNADQAYALYVSALDQIAAYNESYGSILKSQNVKISAESLELYCYGSIYTQDGTAIAEDVVYTPYVYVRDMNVRDTGFNNYDQDGTIMIWDRTATSATEFLETSDPASYETVLMNRGAYFQAKEIVYKGAPVESVLLKVKEVRQVETLKKIPFLVPAPPKVLSAEQLIMLIVVELGAIIALLGYIFKIPQLMIAGGIVALLGFLLSGWISRVALGAEGLWDWLPFWLGGRL